MLQGATIAIVIPCYKVSKHLPSVVDSIPVWIDKIYLVDDACPEKSVANLLELNSDVRISGIFLQTNLGVGGAVKQGYRSCLNDGIDIVVRIDGDGQMDLEKLPKLLEPIISDGASFAKGNRFFNIEDLVRMPKRRLVGNLGLSFFSKFSTGYWDIFDPNNGYNAISGSTLSKLPLEKIDNRYFFESDLLFRLGLIGAKVIDVPMPAVYDQETSNLSILKSLFEFPYKHIKNLFKRIFYNYFLREFNLGSLELVLGTFLLTGGIISALFSWITGIQTGIPTSIGRQMLISMMILAGLQFSLGFLSYDMYRTSSATKNSTFRKL